MTKQLPENLATAIDNYLKGTATPEEKEQVNGWYRSFNDAEIEVPPDSFNTKDQIDKQIETALNELMNNDQEILVYSHRRTLLYRIAAAAVLIFIVSAGTYFLLRTPADVPLVKTDKPVQEKMDLSMKDSSEISSTEAAGDRAIVQKAFSITKNTNGQWVYNFSDPASGAKTDKTAYSTIETPRGRQSQVKLPDGTRIWINAASSVRLPNDFSSNDYHIDLVGEAFFEVAPDKSRKFRVRSGNQIIEVLGTRFNVNAYPDELSINTTLLEGSVRISDISGDQLTIIKPGQQASLEKTVQVSEVNAEDAITWTGGYFRFSNADIKAVGRALQRWYGIDVQYEGALSTQRFGGVIDRKLTLEQVLGILKKSGLRFKLAGKQLTVMQ